MWEILTQFIDLFKWDLHCSFISAGRVNVTIQFRECGWRLNVRHPKIEACVCGDSVEAEDYKLNILW
jgi:hypothetical protein